MLHATIAFRHRLMCAHRIWVKITKKLHFKMSSVKVAALSIISDFSYFCTALIGNDAEN